MEKLNKRAVDCKRLIGFVIGVVIIVVFSMFPTPAPLQPKAWLALGLLLGAVTWIIAKTLRDYQAMIIMCCLLIVTKCVDLGTAFAPFSQSSWWMMFGALGIGAAAVECGFMKRVAFLMLKAFPSSFRGQCVAYIISGAVISSVVPSTTAKAIIMAPMTKSTSEAFGFQKHSKGAQGLFLAMYTGYVAVALAFLSGCAVNVSVVGGLPKDIHVTWLGWLIPLIPWAIITAILMLVVIFMFYGPKKGETVALSKSQVQDELDKMGPWTVKEKITVVVLIVALICWIFEKQIGIDSTVVAVVAAVFLFAAGVAKPEKIRNIGWEALLFVGAFLCLPTVLKTVGINDFISQLLGGVVAPLMHNTFLLIIFIVVLTSIIRLVFVSLSGTAILITAIFIPLCAQYGINPFIVALSSYLAANTWNVEYQNAQTIAGLAAVGPEWLTNRDILKGSFWYMLVNLVALLCSVPYWKFLGMC